MQDGDRQGVREGRELLRRLGFRAGSAVRATLLHTAILATFGFWLPFLKGQDFLDSVVLGAYLCLGVVFAAPAVAGSFAGPAPTFGVALRRIWVAVAYGMVMAWAILITGLILIYSTRPVFVGPDLLSIAEVGVFAALLAWAVGALVAWLSVRYSPGAGRGGARVLFVGLLLWFFLNSRRLPDVALTGAALAAACAVVGVLLLRKTLVDRAA